MGTPGGVRAVQPLPPFCILLLLNHKLYKMDGFLHLCQCGDCLRGRIGLRQADSTTPPLTTHTDTHTLYFTSYLLGACGQGNRLGDSDLHVWA